MCGKKRACKIYIFVFFMCRQEYSFLIVTKSFHKCKQEIVGIFFFLVPTMMEVVCTARYRFYFLVIAI